MARINRREFMKGLSLTAAAVVPMAVPGSALGFDGGVSANERVAMGVVGCGSHSRTWNCPLMLQNPEQQIVAICDPDENNLNAVRDYVNGEYAKQTGKPYSVAAFRDLSARKKRSTNMVAASRSELSTYNVTNTS